MTRAASPPIRRPARSSASIMLWTILLTYPLMVGIQVVSARIGRVSGHGLATNIRRHYPGVAPVWHRRTAAGRQHDQHCGRRCRHGRSAEADCGRPRASVRGGVRRGIAAAAGLHSIPALCAHPEMADAGAVGLRGHCVRRAYSVAAGAAQGIVSPQLSWKPEYITTIVAVFGTTISPYLFFWQASQEVEEQLRRPAGAAAQRGAAAGQAPICAASRSTPTSAWGFRIWSPSSLS